MKTNLAISCGGTGGHFYPGLSIARTLQKSGGTVLLLLSGSNAEKQRQIAESYHINAVALPYMPSPRHLLLALKFAGGLWSGINLSGEMLKKYKINAMLGMGSFASLPPLIAAMRSNIPIFLHDGNAKIGRANRYLSFKAKKLWGAFPPENPKKIHCPFELIGMPLRPEITQNLRLSKLEAISALNQKFNTDLNPALPTVLIFGGSQGAMTFNVTIPDALKKISGKFKFQILHLTGVGKLTETLKNYQDATFKHLTIDATNMMELFYQASDLVVSRAGGSSIAELAYFGKGSLLIPYPYAAENHQFFNAQYLASNDGAKIVLNENCTVDNISNKLALLLENPNILHLMGDNAAKMSIPDSAENILAEISDSL